MITVYRSDDASAPVLSGTLGSLIAVLDACLVNGYGSQASAGWAKPFTGTNLAVYRAPQGNRFYLRLDDTDAQYPVLRGYRAMTAVSTGTGLFPTTVQLSGGIRSVKSYTASSTVRPWIVIASPRAFYLPIPPKVDSHSSANWTPDPSQTGRLFQVKLDGRSEATLGVATIYARRVTSVNVGLGGHG